MRATNRIAVTIATLGIVFAAGTVAYAQTNASLQAELDALLAQLAALQAQLQTTSSTPATPATQTGGGKCPNLYRSLRPGMSGSDVTSLQLYLAADASIYPEGTVSGYYGSLTQKAVQALQQRHNLVTSGTPDSTGFGAVGPATRNLIGVLCASGTPTTPAADGSCLLDGKRVENGKTGNFYSVPFTTGGGNCTAYLQTRQCISGSLSGSTAYKYASCTNGTSPTELGACVYNGVVMANGETRTFYRQEAVGTGQSCQGTTRTCVNGVVGGSSEYPYPSCGQSTGPVSCILDGVVIQDGQSVGFYKQTKVLFGQSCAAFQGTRTCSGGVLSGNDDYRYASCSVAGAQSCTVTVGTTTTTVAHGASRNFWSENSVPYTTTCDAHKLSRTCNDGVLSGSSAYQYPTCTAIAEKGCDIDGITVAGGAKRTFYTSRVGDGEGACAAIDEERTCANGVLSGNAAYKYAYCAPTGQRYCVQDSAYVANNASKTFYTTKGPAFGSSCSQYAQSRKCTDGTLDGTAAYQYASCTEPTGASCTLDGVTVNHNQTRTFYSRSSASNCAEFGQTRTCIDGTLSGSSSFDLSSCSNTTSSIQSASQVAAALSALEALLKSALETLNSWF